MREGIHPNYTEATIVCACGSTFKSRSTRAMIRLDICSACHPFFTGRQKFVDTAGRVERFQKRFEKSAATAGTTKKAAPAPKLAKGQRFDLDKKKMKIITSSPVIVIPVKNSKKTDKPAPKPAAAKPETPKSH